jgi:hypothetical protein
VIKVVHWGTGGTGRCGLQGIIGHPELELVGLYVARPERAGLDAGALCDRPDTGILATNDVEELLAIEADCLSYFGNGSDTEVVQRFLRAGRNVVTTSFGNLILPEQVPPAVLAPWEEACRDGGAALFATGIEPGVGSDLLPLTLLGAVDDLHTIRVTEIASYRDYAVDGTFRRWGFGNQPDEPIWIFEGDFLTMLWGGVVRHLASEVGVELDSTRVVHERAITDHDIDTACGVVKAGTVGAIRFEVQGMVGDEPFAILEHVNHVDASVAPQWCHGITDHSTAYRVEITGRPNMTCMLQMPTIDHDSGGLVVTAMRAINAIPVLATSEPGVLSPMEVPPRPSGNVHPGGRGL